MRLTLALLLALCVNQAAKGADITPVSAALQEPGRHHLEIIVGSDDQQALVPITVITGIADGPTLLAMAGIHGSEYSPIIATQQLAQRVDPQSLAGALILVHMANLPAYIGRTVYISPVDGKNLNRVFPGSATGTLTERLAHLLTNDLYPLADAVLDMHSGDGNEDLRPFWTGYYARAGTKDVIEQSKAMAFAFGLDHIVPFQWQFEQAADAIWAGSAAIAMGIPSIDVEAGGRGIIDPEAISAINTGVRRIMAHLGMTSEPFPPLPVQQIIVDRQSIKAPQDGSWMPLKQAGERVSKGEPIGYLTDWYGRRVFEAVAPNAGVILLVLSAPPAREGETLAIVARVAKP